MRDFSQGTNFHCIFVTGIVNYPCVLGLLRKAMKSLGLLVVWVFLCAAGGARGQFISSSAFDPNCYEPQIGYPNEIDTIVGSTYTAPYLGYLMANFGPDPKTGYNRVLVGGYPNNLLGFDVLTGGPGFDLHNMAPPKSPTNTFAGVPGHFHSPSLTDRLYVDGAVVRIYWADSNGDYDTARTTALAYHAHGDSDFVNDFSVFKPYIAKMTSDSIDDIIMCYWVGWKTKDINGRADHSRDTAYIVHYTGGLNLYHPGDTVLNDSSIFWSPAVNTSVVSIGRGGVAGDFRGTGRSNFIASGGDSNQYIFYYRNDQPFSMEKFRDAMQHDTFFAPRRNPELYGGWTFAPIKVFPKPDGDSSCDLWMALQRRDDSDMFQSYSANFFRGGPNFGSHRLLAKDTDLCIHSPRYYDPTWNIGWGGSIMACGDMTGTGNPVIMIGGGDMDDSYDFFYVMGQAADPMVDMYYRENYGYASSSTGFDTITANGDALEDIIEGTYEPDDLGSISVIYGSKKIPVHLNPKFADRVDIPQSDGAGVTFFPNPTPNAWSVATIIWPDAEITDYEVYNLLGKVVQSGTVRMLGGAQQQRINFPNLPSGVYEVLIHGSLHEAHAKLVIVR
jgi:hypothetical protein